MSASSAPAGGDSPARGGGIVEAGRHDNSQNRSGDTSAQAREHERAIAEIPKNRREVIRVTRFTFKGYQLVGLRVWAKRDDGAAIPTQKGLAFRVDMLDAVIEALVRAGRS